MKEFSQGLLLLSLSLHVRTISFLGHEKSVQRERERSIAFLVQCGVCVCVFVAEDGRQRQTAGSVGSSSSVVVACCRVCQREPELEERVGGGRARERKVSGS